MRPRRVTIIPGERYGRLVVVGEAERHVGGGQRQVACKCDCGRDVTVLLNSLRTQNTTSCGCLNREALRLVNTTHGMSDSKEYAIYRSMVRRCQDPDDPAYPHYGGRGIRVCDRWRAEFQHFLEDMGRKPNGLTLERNNNDGNYEPGNCRWATRTEQQRNRRCNRWISFRGKQYLPADLANEIGVSLSALSYRLRCGASGEELALPTNRNGNRGVFSDGRTD